MRRNQKQDFFNNFFNFNKIKSKNKDVESGQNVSTEVEIKKEEISVPTIDTSSMFESLKSNLTEKYKLLNKTKVVSSSYSSLIKDFEQLFSKLETEIVELNQKEDETKNIVPLIVISEKEPIKEVTQKVKKSTKTKSVSTKTKPKLEKSVKSDENFEIKQNNFSGMKFIDTNIDNYMLDFVKISGEKEKAVLVYRKEWDGEFLTLEYTNNEYVLKSSDKILIVSKDKEELLKNFYANIKKINTEDKIANISGINQKIKCYDRRPIKYDDVYTWYSFYDGCPVTTCCNCGITSETIDCDENGSEICDSCGNIKF